jgi:hypothetical protein
MRWPLLGVGRAWLRCFIFVCLVVLLGLGAPSWAQYAARACKPFREEFTCFDILRPKLCRLVAGFLIPALSGETRIMANEIVLMDPKTKQPEMLAPSTFAELGVKERQDLEEWIRKNPSILGSDLLLITSEYDHF